MHSKMAYMITGILAAVTLTAGAGANAQTTTAAPVSQQPVPTLPATTPPDATPKATDQQTVPPAASPTTTAQADATAPAASGMAAKDFIQQAYLSNEFGIAASQVALKEAKSPATKQAAQAVLNDGMKLRQDMVTAIQGATTDMHFNQGWTDEYKQKLADLQSDTSVPFDQKYLATQGEITQNAATLYGQYAQSGTDASVKTFAANSLPKLQSDQSQLDTAKTSAEASATDEDNAAATKATKTTKHTTHTRTTHSAG